MDLHVFSPTKGNNFCEFQFGFLPKWLYSVKKIFGLPGTDLSFNTCS